MKSSWRKCIISDFGKIVTGKTPKTSVSENYGGNIPFLTPSDDMNIKYVRATNKKITLLGLKEVKNCLLPPNSICVSCIGSDLGKVVMTTEDTVTNQQINSIVVDRNKYDVDFVYYAMLILGKELNYVSKTSTAVPIVNKSTFSGYEIECPKLDEQRKIASILKSLDDKIELNNAINRNLEEQAQAIFKSWFVDFEPFGGKMPEGWKKANLTYIAEYVNGLAMQNFAPEHGDGMPVLKIRELRQGFCDENSDRCDILDRDYIVEDGDVIFSWSGSLLVDLWCGGRCGLNQHLFKVTSKDYDKWFYYLWTKYHLDKFIAIAADKATTMGHIKRDDLIKSMVVLPSQDVYSQITKILSPTIDRIINNRVQNKKLAELRDALLPKLMSGEIDVSNVNV